MPEAISEPRRSYPRHGVHGRLVEAIGRLIIGGGPAAGAVLPREVELMDEFGTSRAAVREAIKVLAAKGLVETRQRRGMRIRALEEWNLLDPDVLAWCAASGPAPLLMAQMVELRCLIEPRAARLAAGRRTAAELGALEAAHAQMVATFADAVAYNLADFAFSSGGLPGLRQSLRRPARRHCRRGPGWRLPPAAGGVSPGRGRPRRAWPGAGCDPGRRCRSGGGGDAGGHRGGAA